MKVQKLLFHALVCHWAKSSEIFVSFQRTRYSQAELFILLDTVCWHALIFVNFPSNLVSDSERSVIWTLNFTIRFMFSITCALQTKLQLMRICVIMYDCHFCLDDIENESWHLCQKSFFYFIANIQSHPLTSLVDILNRCF